MSLSRRGLLRRLAAAATLPIAAACVAEIPRPTGSPGATVSQPGPTTRFGGRLTVLQGSHPVPAFDRYVDAWAARWAATNGLAVRIDRIPPADLRARVAFEATTRSGHDLVACYSSGLAALHRPSLVDLSDLCDRAAARYGGWLPAGEAIGTVGQRWYAYPDFAVPFLNAWRTDRWRAVGFAGDHLESWDELIRNAAALRASGHPAGAAMSRAADAEHTWRALLWSYGAAEFTADGKAVAIDSPETRDALGLAKVLFANEDPEVVTWRDLDNDAYLRSGKGSWICDPIDAFRAIGAADPGLAARIALDGPLAGPAGRIGSMAFTAYGIWAFSPNIAAARQFLLDYSDDWPNQMTASQGFNQPFLVGHARHPMPVFGADSRLAHLQDVGPLLRPVGYPGPPTLAAYDALESHVIADLFTDHCTGRRTMDDAIADASRRLRDSLARFPA
ncbi:MAG TPA: extracellular solute-binding protein [Candidatus Limnocylindria bacterium]|nr:extracellular solute-binding protein [Candidatus Limnocylindria bacterium]